MESKKPVFCGECGHYGHYVSTMQGQPARCCEPGNLIYHPVDKDKTEYKRRPMAINEHNDCPNFIPRTTAQKIAELTPIFILAAVVAGVIILFTCC